MDLFSATWTYHTGNAVTFPSGKYEINGQVTNLYSERNGYRMPAYHHVDVGFTWRIKTEEFESSWNFLRIMLQKSECILITFQQT